MVTMSSKPSPSAAAAPKEAQPASSAVQSVNTPVQPLIAFSLIDAPSQRFYAVALAVSVQAWKYLRIGSQLLYGPSQPTPAGSYAARETSSTALSLSNAVLVNFAVLFVLSRLGIPLLDPRLASPGAKPASPAAADSKTNVLQPASTRGLTYLSYATIFAALTFLDAILLGTGSANPLIVLFNILFAGLRTFSGLLGIDVPLSGIAPDVLSRQLSISEGRVRIRDLIQPKSHILGQHTIHILPHSTAKLAPASACYCVGPETPQVVIPVLFSNTEPDLLQYSITDFASGHSSYFNVSVDSLIPFSASKPDHEADELSAVAAASDSHGRRRRSGTDDLVSDEDDLDEPGSILSGISYGERARIRAERRARSLGKSKSSSSSSIKKAAAARSAQQLLWHLPVTQPGRVRLERVLDKSRNDARLSLSEALVVQCPSTTFIPVSSTSAADAVEKSDLIQAQHKCPGDRVEFAVQVQGIAPLELEYRQIWDGPRQSNGAGRARSSQPHDEKSRRISRIAPPHHTSPLLLPEASGPLSPSEKMALARERTRSATHRGGAGSADDYSWAATVSVDLPLSAIELDQPGNFTYVLDGIQDACGNRVRVGPSAPSHSGSGLSLTQKARKKVKGVIEPASTPIYSQSVVVHARRTVSFDTRQCRPGHPLRLLRNSAGIDLTLHSPDEMSETGDWNVDVSFEPDNSAASNGLWARAPAKPSRQQVAMPSASRQISLRANAPGLYRIEDVGGPFCNGEVGAPWICEVIDVPPPTAQINFSSIEDRCAGPVGVKAMSVLTGTPPFQLEYEVQKQGRHPERKVRTIYDQTRDELDFRPDTEGAVTYKFVRLHDSNYRNIELDGPSFTQVFHPLSSAAFTAQVRSQDDRAVIQSCSGKQAEADVRLSGAGPWDLAYSVRAGEQIETKEVKGIAQPLHKLSIDIPESIAKSGGRMTVSLVKIRDAKGCERSLATRDLNVEVRRVQPNVGFLPVKVDRGNRQVELLPGKQARLPIRLSGQGPWEVEYTWQADESSEEIPQRASLQDINGEILADRPGIYRIHKIRDNYCPGLVLQGQEEYRITQRAKPYVHFSPDAGVVARNGSVVRAAVCQGKPDSVDVLMGGSFPIDVEYEHVAPTWSGQQELDGSVVLASAVNEISASQGKRRRTSFTSALGTTNLELSTLTAGWHTYLLNSVGDAAYTRALLEGFPTTEPRRLEQMVLPLPSGSFAAVSSSTGLAKQQRSKPSLCVGDSLGKLGALPVFKLHGRAPFAVTFEIRSPGADSSQYGSSAGRIHRFSRSGINVHEYKLSLPENEFAFDRKGTWSIRALDIVDANGCGYALSTQQDGSGAASGKGRSSFEIEVAETADITAISSREDYCIGEMVDFTLHGSPPWTVTYDFNGKTAQAAVSSPEFSRVAERAGVLTIKSIAHQQNQCRRDINPRVSQEMVKTIHDLPTVRISEGNHYVEDLREGNQAEIIFHFQGVAPYSFTYQRSEPVDTHARPKILETNTVSGILEPKYSIFAAVEGTWSVTWLQDRWCQVSLDYHSGAATPLGKSKLAIKNVPENES
ncbi:putative nuclear pore membrane protein [Testicularia cyperi]|uniref:Putative nuclear pore membrane protein n=1 Tax=Testicularia cyperi TaxID=1882483 RepID=A0A317XF38_9BASI|nr:putative nuclear pore membrane protein [Testicularia cyperi]